MLIDDLRGRVLADRQIIATYLAAGAKDLDLPDLDAERNRFDEWLNSKPKDEPEDIEYRELLQALGLRA